MTFLKSLIAPTALLVLGLSTAGCDPGAVAAAQNGGSSPQDPVQDNPPVIPVIFQGPNTNSPAYKLAYYGMETSMSPASHWVCATIQPTLVYRQFCEDTASTDDPPANLFDDETWNVWVVKNVDDGTADDAVVVYLKGDEQKYWILSQGADVYGNPEYRLSVNHESSPQTTDFGDAGHLGHRFIFHEVEDGLYNEKRFAIESQYAPGYYLHPQGHGLAAKGVKLSQQMSPATAFAWSAFKK